MRLMAKATITRGVIITAIMTMTTDGAALQRLLAWTSPGYPVGAYSYSHGLEQGVEDGSVRDAADLRAYVEASLERGCGWIDAVFFAHVWRAAEDLDEVDALCDQAAAWRASAELALES